MLPFMSFRAALLSLPPYPIGLYDFADLTQVLGSMSLSVICVLFSSPFFFILLGWICIRFREAEHL